MTYRIAPAALGREGEGARQRGCDIPPHGMAPRGDARLGSLGEFWDDAFIRSPLMWGLELKLRDCARQLVAGGPMIFTVISKQFEMYGKGEKLGEDWYEVHPGVKMFFYDAASIQREFGPLGRVEISNIDEPMSHDSTRPFLNVICEPTR